MKQVTACVLRLALLHSKCAPPPVCQSQMLYVIKSRVGHGETALIGQGSLGNKLGDVLEDPVEVGRQPNDEVRHMLERQRR